MIRIDDVSSNYGNPQLNSFKQKYIITNCFNFSTDANAYNMQSKGEKLHAQWSTIYPNLSQEFFEEIVEVSERLKCDPADLCAIIYRESGFKPNAHGKNPKTGTDYYGLIQMDRTAFKAAVSHACKTQGDNCKLDPNITYEKYAKLPREKQLLYAEAYLKFRIDEKGLTGKRLTGGQLWTLIKRPKAINDEKFVSNVQKKVDKTKQIPFAYSKNNIIDRKV